MPLASRLPMDICHKSALAFATATALATNAHNDNNRTLDLVGRVNDIVLGAAYPFECSTLNQLWFTGAEARHEIQFGLHNCNHTAFYQCRSQLYNYQTYTPDAILSRCFEGQIPYAYTPRKLLQAGKSVFAALKLRLNYLRYDLQPCYDQLQTVFQTGASGSGIPY